MNYILGVITIILGISILANPEAFLRMEDHLRIKGEREYSDTAKFFMLLRGVFSIIVGIVFLFVKF